MPMTDITAIVGNSGFGGRMQLFRLVVAGVFLLIFCIGLVLTTNYSDEKEYMTYNSIPKDIPLHIRFDELFILLGISGLITMGFQKLVNWSEQR